MRPKTNAEKYMIAVALYERYLKAIQGFPMPRDGFKIIVSHAVGLVKDPNRSQEPPAEFTEHWRNLELYESAKSKLTPDEYDSILAYEKPHHP